LVAGTYSASHCVNPVSRSPSGGMEEGGTGVREGAALHPQKQWLELNAQNGPHAQSKHTLTPSVDRPSAVRHTYPGCNPPRSVFGGGHLGNPGEDNVNEDVSKLLQVHAASCDAKVELHGIVRIVTRG